jgi:hypothetical protein
VSPSDQLLGSVGAFPSGIASSDHGRCSILAGQGLVPGTVDSGGRLSPDRDSSSSRGPTVPQPFQAAPAGGVASGNIRDPCLAGLSPARSQPRRHGFSLTDSYRVPWYDYAVTHLRETGLSEDEARLVMNHLDASTARNYTGKYSEFALSFCEPRGLCPCPADTNTIVKYLSWQADKGTVAATSLPQYLSAIGCRHTDVGLPSPCTGSSDPGVTDFCPVISNALTGYAKGFNYADFGRSDTHANMLVGDVQFFGNGDLHFAHRKVKGLSGRVEASDYLWPADSCPDLLRALSFWLTLRSRMRLHPDGCEHMWRLPWEKSGFTTSRLRTIFADTLSSLNRRPPPGRKWTLHCIRAGPASECNALGIPISTIRRQGGWSAKSRVPSDRYIDSQCPPSAAGRRFFDWLTPDGHLRRLGAS